MKKLDDDVDALFKLPLAEFTAARNALAARLKQNGQRNEANLVKTVAKPSISAWAVNQLYWRHREAFDKLLAAGERVRQASRVAGKVANMRGALDARRETLSDLSDLATSVLSDAGHNPAPDTLHRITTTLEALSAHASLSDGPTLGRLTQDVDPPGFESLASLFPGGSKATQQPARLTASQKPVAADTTTRQKPAGARQLEQMRRAKISAAKVTLQDAKTSLTHARAKAQRLEAAQKNAQVETKEAQARVKEAEKELRQAQERFKKASAASEDAAVYAQRTAAEAKEATQAVNDANRAVEKARKELESLFQES